MYKPSIRINVTQQEWESFKIMKPQINFLSIIWTLTFVIYCISEESTAYRSSISFKTINLYLLEWWICTNFLYWRHCNLNFEVRPQKVFNRRRQKVFNITVFPTLNKRSSFEKNFISKKDVRWFRHCQLNQRIARKNNLYIDMSCLVWLQ